MTDVLYALGHGPANARRKIDLAHSTGLPTRTVELEIQHLRLEGHPICSDENGYWLGTVEEVEACARRLRSRYINQAMTARALRKTARRMAGYQQRELWAA